MDILTQKELLVDAIDEKRSTISVDNKELSQLALLSKIQVSSSPFGSDEESNLLIHIAAQNALNQKDCLRLANMQDDKAAVYIKRSSEKNDIQPDKITAGLGALIKKANFNSAATMTDALNSQSIDYKTRSYTADFCQAGRQLQGFGGNQIENEEKLIELMNDLPWDITEKVQGREITQHFQSYNLPTAYGHVSRKMADNIKQNAGLDNDEAKDRAGSAVNLRPSL